MPGGEADGLAVVVVTYRSAEHLGRLAAALLPQLGPSDEVVIVDNASGDGTAEAARALSERVHVIEAAANGGFAAGTHAGADATSAPLLFFLNPDCELREGCLAELRATGARHPDWSAWQAAVLLDDERVNSDGGVAHYLGIGWAGGCDQPAAPRLADGDREIAFPSGAALVVRREAWDELAGLDPAYFMYGEDLDLGLRLWLAGRGVGLSSAARVAHGYEFDKGESKWFWLERNRWRTVLSVYPAPLLALLLPALLAAEIGLLAIAARGGWLRAKLRAQGAAIAALAPTLARRREVQRGRRVTAREFAAHLTASLESPYIGLADDSALGRAQALYWRLVLRLLAFASR